MSGPHPTSDEVRGLDGRSSLRAALATTGYVVLTALGMVGAAVTPRERLAGGAGLFFALLVVVGGAGVALVVHDWWFVRHRPRVSLGTAPSGRPAVVIVRSGFRTVGSVVVTSVLVVVFATGAVALLEDHPGWAVVCALVALVLVWPLVPFARGRVRAGGLYLTAVGLEHHRDAVGWSVRWEQVAAASPREPVAIVLEPGERAETTVSARGVWNREVDAPAGVLGVECRSLALDGVLVAAAVNTAVARPERRAELGTDAALRWDVFGTP